MNEDYFSIYIQWILLISFGIYYFLFKDKDKFLVTMLFFMFLILSYPYISSFLSSISMPSTGCPDGTEYFSKKVTKNLYSITYPNSTIVVTSDGDYWNIYVSELGRSIKALKCQ
tara:strand:+ start:1154 stop:1495 length:342 start_codon:yes stop_codon:yes gene_type:complete